MTVSLIVVEDHDELRNAVRTLLEHAGYIVHCAKTPEEALEFLACMPKPCILLWDATMRRQSVTMVEKAMFEGVRVATLPVSVSPASVAGGRMTRRLVNVDGILSIVQEHCPLEDAIA
jgi:CheY-like chemotaxis protein